MPGTVARQQRRGAADLARSGQEDQDAAGDGTQRQLDGARDPQLQRLGRVAAQMLDPDREQPPVAAHHRRAAQMRGQGRAVQRRRHDQQPQVGAQRLLHLQAQGEPEIGVERALVELVEDHRAIGFQAGSRCR